MPLFPVVLAAGATRYLATKFLTALTLGPAVRFTVLAFVAARYSDQILTLISHHGVRRITRSGWAGCFGLCTLLLSPQG
jgi:CTP:molybdopterin cytidylyltransferase MocA